MLHDFFNKIIIYKGLWLPKSPDPSLLDFIIRNYLNNLIIKSNPHTLEQLKINMNCVIAEISVKIVNKFPESF